MSGRNAGTGRPRTCSPCRPRSPSRSPASSAAIPGPCWRPIGPSAARKRPSDLTAYDLYLLATEDKQRETKESITEAIDLLNRSLEIDPNFARAWMVLGSCYAIALRWTDNWDETHALYEKYMRRAVELDPMDAEAHAGLGFALAHDGDLKQAEAEFVEALRLNPSSADVLTRYAFWASGFGKPDEGAAMAERAMRLNPNAPPWAIRFLRSAFFTAGQYERALEIHQRLPKEMFADADYIEAAEILIAARSGRGGTGGCRRGAGCVPHDHDRELDGRSGLDRRGATQGGGPHARGRLSRLRQQGGARERRDRRPPAGVLASRFEQLNHDDQPRRMRGYWLRADQRGRRYPRRRKYFPIISYKWASCHARAVATFA